MSTRTQIVMNAIGWQGGTVHDLCKELGLTVNEFLYATPEGTHCMGSDFTLGWFAGRTSPDYTKTKAKIDYYGNLNFWLGVHHGIALQLKQ